MGKYLLRFILKNSLMGPCQEYSRHNTKSTFPDLLNFDKWQQAAVMEIAVMQVWPEDRGRELPLDIVKVTVIIRNDTPECVFFKRQFRIELYVKKVVMLEELSNQPFPFDCAEGGKETFASLEDHFQGFFPLIDLNATSPQNSFDSILIEDMFKISDGYKLLPKRVRSSQAANAFSNSVRHRTM